MLTDPRDAFRGQIKVAKHVSKIDVLCMVSYWSAV